MSDQLNFALLDAAQDLGSTEDLKQEESSTSWFDEIKDTTAFKASMFGLNGLFYSVHLLTNGGYLSRLGAHGEAASPVVSTYLSVVLGISAGFVLPTGLAFGGLSAQGDKVGAGHVAKAAMLLVILCGAFSTALMVLSPVILPVLIDDSQTVQVASDFLSGYAVSAIPLMLSFEVLQIASIAGDWFIPGVSMGAVWGISAFLSYYLGSLKNMGALGIGLAGGLANLIVGIGMGLWLLKNKYKEYGFYSMPIGSCRDNIKWLVSEGWKIALQRLSEWLNLFLISLLVASRSQELEALDATMLIQLFLAISLQSFAQGVGMEVSARVGKMKKIAQTPLHSQEALLNCHQANIKTIMKAVVFIGLLSSVLTGVICAARKPLSALLVSGDGKHARHIEDLSQHFLWINTLGLLFDALRILFTGALRGWNELEKPAAINLVLLSGVSVAVGFGLSSHFEHHADAYLWSRNCFVILAAIWVGKICKKQIKKDELHYGLFQPYLNDISDNKPYINQQAGNVI